MNKKGFTLVELLATIVILGVVLTIGTVSLTGLKKSIDKKNYRTEIELMMSAAEMWGNDNKNILGENPVVDTKYLMYHKYYENEKCELSSNDWYDVTGDGTVDLLDYSRMRSVAAGRINYGKYQLFYDLNGDGEITSSDSSKMTSIALGKTLELDNKCAPYKNVNIKVYNKHNRVYSCIVKDKLLEYEEADYSVYADLYCD